MKKYKWEWLIVTDGPKGVHIFSKNNKYIRVFVYTNKLKDVSGAGDTFLSALVYFYSNSLSIIQACKMAARAATKVVEKEGVIAVKKRCII